MSDLKIESEPQPVVSKGGDCRGSERVTACSPLRFGQAIAASQTVRLHTGDNTYGESATFPTLPPPVAWSVYVADRQGFRTVAADFDASKGDPDADARDFITTLERCGLKAVLVASGPTRGRHVLLTFPTGLPAAAVKLLHDQLAQTYPSFDPSSLLPTSTIRPPYAPHRLGGASHVLDQELAAALSVLQTGNDSRPLIDLLVALGVPAWTAHHAMGGTDIATAVAKLSPNLREMLLTGEKRHSDTSRSGVQFSVLVGAINAGLDFATIVHLLRAPKHQGGERFQADITRRGEERALQRLWHDWERAEQFVATNPTVTTPTDVRILLTEQLDLAMRLEWKGTAGNTDRAIYIAVMNIAIQNGTLTPTASFRQLAEAAKIAGHPTAIRSIRRLQKRGLLSVEKKGSGSNGTMFRVSTALVSEKSTTNHHNRRGCVINGALLGNSLTSTQHDVFRRAGLGLSGWQIYSALDLVESMSAEEIRECSGVSRGTVYPCLAKLVEYGLAVKAGSGRWLRADVDLDEVASELGVQGATAKQHARHAIDRELYGASRTRVVRVEDGWTWFSNRKKERTPARSTRSHRGDDRAEDAIGLAHVFNVAFDAPRVDDAGMRWYRWHPVGEREKLFATFTRVLGRSDGRSELSAAEVARRIIDCDAYAGPIDCPEISDSPFETGREEADT